MRTLDCRLLLVAAALSWPAAALADGAFPDGQAVLQTPARPHSLYLSTNFGLMISSDDGASWRTVCEAAVNAAVVRQYQAGVEGTLYAASANGLSVSTDDGCSWESAGSAALQLWVSDVWADASLAGRVFAVVSQSSQSLVVRSDDRGATVAARFFAPDAGVITGVESARADPHRVYVTGWQLGAPDGVPFVARSDDDGATFIVQSHPELPAATLLIASVDPVDPDTLYLREVVGNAQQDVLLVSHDGGASLTPALSLGAPMSAFLRSTDGTVYVGSRDGDLWLQDAGQGPFEHRASLSFRCLAERSGQLLGCGSESTDGFALGSSGDRGLTWSAVTLLKPQGPFNCCPRVQQVCAPAPDPTCTTPAPAKACGCSSGGGLTALAAVLALALRRGGQGG